MRIAGRAARKTLSMMSPFSSVQIHSLFQQAIPFIEQKIILPLTANINIMILCQCQRFYLMCCLAGVSKNKKAKRITGNAPTSFIHSRVALSLPFGRCL
jgi:hypothetical protein